MIIALFPLPGYIASQIQAVEISRMKKTDARVQAVTEGRFSITVSEQSLKSRLAMNVLRMIKLFGWEKSMNEKIEGKREEELIWIWKRQVLDLTKGFLK